jgi:hypothetical protein
MDGWMDLKANLRIAYRNKELKVILIRYHTAIRVFHWKNDNKNYGWRVLILVNL